MKKEEIIYIKSTVGTLPVMTGVKGIILKVNKKEGKIYSIRVEVINHFSFDKGFTKESYAMTYRTEIPSYEFFTKRIDFVNSLQSALINFKTIIDEFIFEVSLFN